jgi:hypothetical protein
MCCVVGNGTPVATRTPQRGANVAAGAGKTRMKFAYGAPEPSGTPIARNAAGGGIVGKVSNIVAIAAWLAVSACAKDDDGSHGTALTGEPRCRQDCETTQTRCTGDCVEDVCRSDCSAAKLTCNDACTKPAQDAGARVVDAGVSETPRLPRSDAGSQTDVTADASANDANAPSDGAGSGAAGADAGASGSGAAGSGGRGGSGGGSGGSGGNGQAGSFAAGSGRSRHLSWCWSRRARAGRGQARVAYRRSVRAERRQGHLSSFGKVARAQAAAVRCVWVNRVRARRTTNRERAPARPTPHAPCLPAWRA